MNTRRIRGFTLVELLVVIAIIGILVALLLPAIQAAREAARRTDCVNKLKQVGLGFQNHGDIYKAFPKGSYGHNGLSWTVKILPFIEEQTLYDNFDFTKQYTDTSGKNNMAQSIVKMNAYFCPSGVEEVSDNAGTDTVSGTRSFTTHYYASMGANGVIPGSSPAANYALSAGTTHGGWGETGAVHPAKAIRFADITDGTSKTFLVGEISWRYKPNWSTVAPINANFYRAWTRGCNGANSAAADSCGTVKQVKDAPNRFAFDNAASPTNFNMVSFGSQHPGGVQFCLVDGSVRFVTDTVDLDTYHAAASRNGGEARQLD